MVEKANSNMNDVNDCHHSPSLSERKADSFSANNPSRTLVSFDFSDGNKGIKITEDNLLSLKRLIQLTGLENRTAEEVLGVITRFSTQTTNTDTIVKLVLSRSDFGRCVRLIVPEDVSIHFSNTDAELISLYFSNFFNCFSYGSKDFALGSDYVDSIELAIGLSFFCKGKKSTKLASTFEMLDEKKTGFLSQTKILRYLRSYLTMLAGVSLLSSSTDILSDRRRLKLLKPPITLLESANDGARWTLDHFIKSVHKSGLHRDLNEFSFETFAGWYTNGGYNHAPWLEFLDLKKFFSLLVSNDMESANVGTRNFGATVVTESNVTLPQIEHSVNKPVSAAMQPPVAHILFSFPLANRQSLVVLKEDASYVYSVVCNLGLVHCSPEELWRSLWKRSRSLSPTKPVKTLELDKSSFVTFLSDILADKGSLRSNEALLSIKETICNFYLSFDLDQKNRVAANQLMGGLTLLCNGKKSTKLSFSFRLFDGGNDDIDISSKSSSLDGRELFYFLRSFLIVMFSCCKQSLHLSSMAVARNISDTAYTVTDNVMRYQWRNKGKSRVDFEEFGDWYNQGGFETAPWLELLDLSKWALKDVIKSDSSKSTPSSFPLSMELNADAKQKNTDEPILHSRVSADTHCPPPPPDDQFDPNSDDFFGDHITMDGIDEYDFDFNDISDGIFRESISQSNVVKPLTSNVLGNPLNFQVFSGQDNGGFLINVSSQRVSLIRQVLSESRICNLEVSAVCNIILSKANNKKLTKENFIAATKTFSQAHGTTQRCNKVLNELYNAIFDSFDTKQCGKVDAKVLACGCAVICNGRKSDKLEYTFDLLEKGQAGLNQADMIRYLESFLNVLLTISSCPLDGEGAETVISFINNCSRKSTVPSLPKVSHIGCSWATAQVFNSDAVRRSGSDRICFEAFASWYTKGGHTNIQWLELLDLRKWILADCR
jgi:Ca2+-binding EF-hand superfamily protein